MTCCLVYGIVPADVEATEDARGVGDPPAEVTAVAHGKIGALVSEVRLDRPLGTPEDLTAYQRLLDSTAAEVPVLPGRFGAALSDAAAVEDFLASQHDTFVDALERIDGHVEFVVRARYVTEAVVRRILSENEGAATLRDQVRGQPEKLTVDARVRLGENIYRTIEAERAADTQRLVEALGDSVTACQELPPTHDEDAAHVAVLVATAGRDDFEDAVRKVADEWDGRATVRLLGPLAPYDFVAPGTGT